MSLPHSSLEIITTKEVTTKKSDLSNAGISSWDPSVESVEITFGLLFTSNAVWIWFAKILLHLQIYITLLFFLAAKAFKISQSRYPESVWQSATDHVTEGEWRERGERGKCWGPSVSWYKRQELYFPPKNNRKLLYMSASQMVGRDLNSIISIILNNFYNLLTRHDREWAGLFFIYLE